MGSNRKGRPDGFVVYGKTLQSICLLPEEKAGRVMKAAARLFLDGQEPEGLELSEQIVFALFQADIDSALARHTEVCTRNQRIAANRKAPVVTSRDVSLPDAQNRNEQKQDETKRKETESKESTADKPPTRTRFTPPTLEEVRAYCRSRNSPVDPVKFYDYFTEGHWKDSNGKPVKSWKQKLITWENMKDWKAAVRNWERRDDHAGRSDSGHGADAAQTGSIGGITRL